METEQPDISGQERFGNMTRVYYKESVGAFVLFDVTRVGTFEAVQKWKDGNCFVYFHCNNLDIDLKVRLWPDERPIPVVILANKVILFFFFFSKAPVRFSKERLLSNC